MDLHRYLTSGVTLLLVLLHLSGLSQVPEAALNKLGGMHGNIVVISLGPDCPISQKYMHTLREFYSEYKEDADIIGLVPYTFTSSEINDFASEYAIPFELLQDDRNELIDAFDLSVTPEVVVINRSSGEVRYQGAIDNWFYELGKSRWKPTEHYLINVMDAIRAGSTVNVKSTEAVGCVIEKYNG